jgi:uncharacterized membrane protein YphA (DoxX/SURF4 family)
MNVALWILASLLAAAFLASGLVKLAWPKSKLLAKGNAWAEQFSPAAVKAIGVAEVLAAVGLVLPRLLHVAEVLTPLAATGLALLMAGAAVVHQRRGESRAVAATAVYLALAAFVAVARF